MSWLLLDVPTWLRTQTGAVTTNNEQGWCFLLFPFSGHPWRLTQIKRPGSFNGKDGPCSRKTISLGSEEILGDAPRKKK